MNDKSPADKLLDAYNTMLDRVRHALGEAEQHTLPTLKHAVDQAMEKASELGEVTREEAEKIGGYLRRDVEDAAKFITEQGKEFADWARFDLEQVEKQAAEAFRAVADKTVLELKHLERQADVLGEWHTGEVTSIGTLKCTACGEELHFRATGHIPPCPKCRGTVYRRVSHSA